MRKSIALMTVGLWAVLGIGCIGPTQGSRTMSEPLETTSNLIYMDRTLNIQIPCEVLEAELLDSGRMEIYGRFYNKRNKPAECQIQVKFKSEDGRIVDETGWMPFLLPRREVKEFRHISLAAEASDFVLLLREAK